MPLALAQGDGSTAALTEILMSSSWAKVGLGRYDEVRTESRALSDLLAEADDDEGGALLGGLEARCALFGGKPVSAVQLSDIAIRRYGPISSLGFRPLLHTGRAWDVPAAISDELTISVRTVESHLYRAFAKLGVRAATSWRGAWPGDDPRAVGRRTGPVTG